MINFKTMSALVLSLVCWASRIGRFGISDQVEQQTPAIRDMGKLTS
jgi:hypothetical protein